MLIQIYDYQYWSYCLYTFRNSSILLTKKLQKIFCGNGYF